MLGAGRVTVTKSKKLTIKQGREICKPIAAVKDMDKEYGEEKRQLLILPRNNVRGWSGQGKLCLEQISLWVFYMYQLGLYLRTETSRKYILRDLSHYAKWKQRDSKGHILHNYTYVWYLEWPSFWEKNVEQRWAGAEDGGYWGVSV